MQDLSIDFSKIFTIIIFYYDEYLEIYLDTCYYVQIYSTSRLSALII